MSYQPTNTSDAAVSANLGKRDFPLGLHLTAAEALETTQYAENENEIFEVQNKFRFNCRTCEVNSSPLFPKKSHFLWRGYLSARNTRHLLQRTKLKLTSTTFCRERTLTLPV